jgi:hypothetical protein
MPFWRVKCRWYNSRGAVAHVWCFNVFHNFSWYTQSWGMLRCLLFPQNPEKPQTRQSCPVRTRVWLKSVSSLPELACGCCNGADGFWLHQRVADGHVHHFSAAWVAPLGTSMYLPKIDPPSISPTKGGFLSWLIYLPMLVVLLFSP